MRAFLANASLRPSCSVCPCKRSCGSDVTLGDFWGVQSAHPEVDCGGGVSAVVCNTSRGVAAVGEVKHRLGMLLGTRLRLTRAFGRPLIFL